MTVIWAVLLRVLTSLVVAMLVYGIHQLRRVCSLVWLHGLCIEKRKRWSVNGFFLRALNAKNWSFGAATTESFI